MPKINNYLAFIDSYSIQINLRKSWCREGGWVGGIQHKRLRHIKMVNMWNFNKMVNK